MFLRHTRRIFGTLSLSARAFRFLTGPGRTWEIQEGAAASREFVRVTFGDVIGSDRKRGRRALDLYCGLDRARQSNPQGFGWGSTRL
jgi:hypothetical protein